MKVRDVSGRKKKKTGSEKGRYENIRNTLKKDEMKELGRKIKKDA
jgi:hypothetical protein